jgi:hypothetical protein
VAQLYPRALAFLSVASYDSQGFGGGIGATGGAVHKCNGAIGFRFLLGVLYSVWVGCVYCFEFMNVSEGEKLKCLEEWLNRMELQ